MLHISPLWKVSCAPKQYTSWPLAMKCSLFLVRKDFNTFQNERKLHTKSRPKRNWNSWHRSSCFLWVSWDFASFKVPRKHSLHTNTRPNNIIKISVTAPPLFHPKNKCLTQTRSSHRLPLGSSPNAFRQSSNLSRHFHTHSKKHLRRGQSGSEMNTPDNSWQVWVAAHEAHSLYCKASWFLTRRDRP